MRTPLILFSGKYLGLMAPDEHYIELKKDFSNVDDVLDRLRRPRRSRIAWPTEHIDRLVGSGQFSYRCFAGLIGDTIKRKAGELRMPLRSAGRSVWADRVRSRAGEPEEFREQPTVMPRHPASSVPESPAGMN